MNEKNRNYVFWILIIVIIILGIYNIIWVKSNSFECVSNPAGYTFQKLREANNNKSVSCLCSVEGEFGAMAGLNEQGFFPLNKSR